MVGEGVGVHRWIKQCVCVVAVGDWWRVVMFFKLLDNYGEWAYLYDFCHFLQKGAASVTSFFFFPGQRSPSKIRVFSLRKEFAL